MQAGCAAQPYWVLTGQPYTGQITVRETTDIDKDCGPRPYEIAGCVYLHSGDIFIGSWLNAEEKRCVESHERKHLQGFSHDYLPVDRWYC